ncbi:MAG: YigZ family protein [Clostridia bacterium]|nr:YigZ family protein [Clostridia bacterium]
MKEYITVEHRYDEEYIINKSRFIGYCAPVSTAEEAVEFVNEIKKRHADATHNVYAYQIRSPEYSRYSDDGEPQGTAGMPVLDVIKKNGLTDVCVVVTRYFGGILLGAGGLVRAYSHSAKIAVDGANIIRMSPCSVLKVVCDYGFYGRLSTLVPEFGGITESTDFAENVTLVFRLPSTDEEHFRKELTEASFGKVSAEKIGEKFDSI